MAHYAEIINNTVNQVLVLSNDMSHEECLQWLYKNVSTNEWLQTSYTSKIRGKFAGIGDTYRRDLDAFISPKPYPSWILNEDTLKYDAPIVKPEGNYKWNEEELGWEDYELPFNL